MLGFGEFKFAHVLKSILFFFGVLILNFSALSIGGFFTADGVSSGWYETLHKAPWTPPGWVFGAAWTFLMLCYSIYLTILYKRFEQKRTFWIIYSLQWVLNVSWNPVFFKFHQAILGLVLIFGLLGLIFYQGISNRQVMRYHTAWILPYFLWLLIATSLNAYIVFNN